MSTRVKVRVLHSSSIPNARWCEPVDWEPANEIDGAEYIDGSWWDATEEVAGIVTFDSDANTLLDDECIEVPLDSLRIASCGDCRVIGPVTVCKWIVINHEQFGARTLFTSIGDAVETIRDMGEEFENVTLEIRGNEVVDNRGEVVGSVVNDDTANEV